MSLPWEDFGPWNDFEEKSDAAQLDVPKTLGDIMPGWEKERAQIPTVTAQATLPTNFGVYVPPVENREQQVMEQTWADLSATDKLASDISRLGREAIEGVGSTVKGYGLFTELKEPGIIDEGWLSPREVQFREEQRARRALETPEETRQRISASPAVQLGERISAFGERQFPTIQPESVNRPLGAIAGGIGSAASFIPTSIAGPGAVMLSGAFQSGASAYEEAVNKGASQDAAETAFVLNALGGTTEALPLSRIFNRINKASGGSVGKALKEMIASGFEEASQEAFQTVLGNASAKYLYDDEREILDNIAENAGTGGAVGFLLSAFGIGTAGAARRIGRPQPPSVERTPDAVQRQTETVLRDVLEPQVTQEGQVQVPVSEGSQAAAETLTAEQLAALPVDQFHEYRRGLGINQVAEQARLLAATDPAVLAKLAENAEVAAKAASDAVLNQVDAEGNPVPQTPERQIAAIEAAQPEQQRAQFFKETLLKSGSPELVQQALPQEEQIPEAERPNVFSMDDPDLENFINSEFPKTPVESGLEARPPTYSFPSFDAFKQWMDARYAERDLDGMKLAFAEADTATKVRFIKENRAQPDHKRAWIAHLATGAPLPAIDPPVARTTPRPGPSGAAPAPGPTPSPKPSPSTPPPPSRPAPPPPPPRAPTHRRKFDVMALVQMFRQLSRFPVVNERLKKVYGRFVPATEAVELKQRLMWDTSLAERVLGHEIGHFLDFVIREVGKGKMLGQRFRPFYDFRGRMWQAQALRDEARRLSRAWRGPFLSGHPYRDTANELFADFMSAMFNNPEWVNKNFPTLFDAFQEVLDSKPQFKSAYREIETWLQGGTMAREFIDQQQKSVQRTIDQLENLDKPSKASLMDRIRFATLSLWHRAYQKEGKPRELGKSISDELEYSRTWAAKEDALMADDFLKTVQPELQKVDNDPVKARSYLTAYSQAVRTIGERRAAGAWIESHPNESRAILQRLLNLDPSLHSKWIAALSTATNDQLYDLSAAIFRDIHDRDQKFVNRMIKAIDDLALGVDGEAALMAFNVRGKLLNPGGLTPENAQAVLDELSNQLGGAKFTALGNAASALRDLMFSTQEKMHDEGLISDQIWNELILPNRDNYVPYAVLDYFDGKVRAGVMPQKGTAKDIADVSAAVQLKIASANAWRQRQRQVQLVRDAYAKGGTAIPLGEQLKRASDLEQIQRKNQNDDVSRAVLWSDGKPHVVEFQGDPGKMLERAFESPAFYEHMGWIMEASDITHRVMQLYTQFSVPFLFWRNPVRGARTAALSTGFGRVGQQVTQKLPRNVELARNYAEAAFGAPMLPEIRDLVDRQILLPPRLSQAMVRDASSLRQMLENHAVLANQIRKLHVGKPSWWKGGEIGRQGVILSEKVFSGYEAFEKIYNYYAAIEKGLSPEKAGALARRRGIPKPGVGGKWSMAMEVWFPWTRVHLQGLRASYDILKNPELGKAFATRFAMTEAVPRVAKVAIGAGIVAGLIKHSIRSDEDDDDGVMAEFLRRVSPYKMALDDIVPLYFYDPRTGKVHYLWEFKSGAEIPKHYEAVSFRIPASEEGRMFGTLLYQMMIAAPGAQEKLGQPGKGFVEQAGNWTVNNLAPGISPIIETGDNLKDMILLGKNAEDPFRGQPAANPMMFEAGGVNRAQAVAGYVLNQLGSPGELAGVMAANFGVMDERALNSMSRRLPTDYKTWNDRIPFLKSAIAHDNYGQYREERMEQIEEDRLRANARLLMPPEPRALYDYYYKNIDRKDKMTPVESKQFAVASYFVNNIWGKLTVDGQPNPDSFYSKAAHAVGKDGSTQAKETFKRDLNAAAAPTIAEFMRLNRLPSR